LNGAAPWGDRTSSMGAEQSTPPGAERPRGGGRIGFQLANVGREQPCDWGAGMTGFGRDIPQRPPHQGQNSKIFGHILFRIPRCKSRRMCSIVASIGIQKGPFSLRLAPVVHRGSCAARSARGEADAAVRGGTRGPTFVSRLARSWKCQSLPKPRGGSMAWSSASRDHKLLVVSVDRAPTVVWLCSSAQPGAPHLDDAAIFGGVRRCEIANTQCCEGGAK
jgi:hypothetical protein